MIYVFVAPNGEDKTILAKSPRRPTRKLHFDSLPALCRASAQMFEEAIPALLPATTVVLNDSTAIANLAILLECVPPGQGPYCSPVPAS
jgi:hypothetical protein